MDPVSDPQPSPQTGAAPGWTPRIVALIEVLLCSDYPTQAAIGATFVAAGYGPYADHQLRIGYVVGVSIIDSIFLIAMIVLMLSAHGESPRRVFNAAGRILPEVTAGVPMTAVALGIGILVLLAVQRFAPTLHTVADNPLQALLKSKGDALLFAAVVILAGGVREEIQRAFLLHRFEQFLGGRTVGVVVTSVAFGAGHLLQGADAAIATGLLGAFWGIVYLRRRSVIAPMVSHAGFDLVQILQFVSIGR